MKKNFNGIWFYGISGSGKSFASKYLNKIKKNKFISIFFYHYTQV